MGEVIQFPLPALDQMAVCPACGDSDGIMVDTNGRAWAVCGFHMTKWSIGMASAVPPSEARANEFHLRRLRAVRPAYPQSDGAA